MPVGTILAWHKSLSGTPLLPIQFVECNGQILNDPSSPYNGQAIPNLNSMGRFLRGGSTSGTMQTDAFQGNKHRVAAITTGQWTFRSGGDTSHVYKNIASTTPISDGVNGTPRTANETRPVNMSVV